MVSYTAERNMDIYKKRKEGAKLSSLATEYGITSERIRQIIKKQQRIIDGIEMRERKKGDFKNLEDLDWPFYNWVLSLAFFDENNKTYIRALNCFYRYAVLPKFKGSEYYKMTVRDVLPIIVNVDPADVIKWRGIGVKSFDTFFNIVDLVKKIADEKGWAY